MKVIQIKTTWGHYLNKFIITLISMISMYLKVRAGVGIRDKHRRGEKWFLHAEPQSVTHFAIILCWHGMCVILFSFWSTSQLCCSNVHMCNHLLTIGILFLDYGLILRDDSLKALQLFYLWHASNVTLHTPCTCMTTHETHARCKKRQYLRGIPVRQLLMHVLIIFFVLTCFNIWFLY